MTFDLDERDRALLQGDRGPAAALAMRIILRMAEVFEAGSLLDITQAHIDSTIYIGEANLEFAERLAHGGARVAVLTTLNVIVQQTDAVGLQTGMPLRIDHDGTIMKEPGLPAAPAGSSVRPPRWGRD